MSILADFLNENGFSATDVAKRSASLEAFDDAARVKKVVRREARRTKKPYTEVGADKPSKLGRGVSERTVKSALAGDKIPRTGRKKITKAVSSLLQSKKKDPVDWRKLFADVGAKKGKSTAKA